MALQRLKLFVVKDTNTEVIEFNSYREVENYADKQEGVVLTPLLEETPETDKNFLQNKLQQEVQERKEELDTEHLPGEVAPAVHLEGEKQEKQFLQNGVKEQVEQKKKSSPKKSFWDNLK